MECNGVSLPNKVIPWNPKEFAVSQNFNKVIKENEKVTNDYYWKCRVGLMRGHRWYID